MSELHVHVNAAQSLQHNGRLPKELVGLALRLSLPIRYLKVRVFFFSGENAPTIHYSDAVVFDLTPFSQPSSDDGTAARETSNTPVSIAILPPLYPCSAVTHSL